MTFLSLTVALALVSMLLPAFNQLTGKQISLDPTPEWIGTLLVLCVATGVISGSYPAFYLSGLQPVSMFQGRVKNAFSELLARKGLVVFQFAISLFLIVAVVVVHRQLHFIQSKNLGYDKSNVLYLEKEGAAQQNPEAFLAALRKIPGVLNASAIQQSVVQNASGASPYGVDWPGKTEKDLINFNIRAVDYDLIETLDIPFREGRSFSRAFGAEERNIIFNETAIRAMGLNDPVGKSVRLWGEEKTIIGVVRDFHLASLHEPIAPMVFTYRPQNTALIMAKIQAGQEQATIGRLKQFYQRYNPGCVFDFRFLDEDYQALYVSENRVSTLSRYFAGLAILISCLGLFGLATFTAGQRSKEIGIRKVLGASVAGITRMLAADFLRLVVLAIVIASPLAWWAMRHWLGEFAYHIDLQPWMFAGAAAAAIGIALLTVGVQSARAALVNPVEVLRKE